MDIVQSVLYGFQVALQPLNLVYCFFGVLIGTLVGVLPGLDQPLPLPCFFPRLLRPLRFQA